MTARKRRRVGQVLWIAYGVLAILGLALLGEALFVPRNPRPLVMTEPPRTNASSGLPVLMSSGGLSGRRMTRHIEGKTVSAATKTLAVGIDSLIRLAGVMDFGGKQPSLAVIEILPEGGAKAYRNGDKIGETGIIIREIAATVIVEFESRRFRLSPAGIQELPARALGTTGSGRSGD